MGNRSLSVACKWKKTKWLMEDDRLKQYVPNTEVFHDYTLELMLGKHDMIYLKPARGSGGRRIVRITTGDDGRYVVRRGKRKPRSFASIESLYKHMIKIVKKKLYILQRGIRLEHTNGLPFDLRVMAQKDHNRLWKTTGIIAKIGSPDKVVNNYHQGGSLALLEDTLEGAGYSGWEIDRLESKLKRIGVRTGECFDRQRGGFRELGLDVAIDRNGKPWILEVNTRPAIRPLKQLRGSKMYRRIERLAKHYGRL